MPPRKTPAAKTGPVPATVEDVTGFLVELLDHVNLRDAGELAGLRAKLTGEEVPSGDNETDPGEGPGEE